MRCKRTVLDNGMRVLVVPQRDNPTATVLVLVEAGSKYETKENMGVAHFLEHLCFKGTVRRPSSLIINRELDGLGAASNAFTSHEYTGYYAKVQARKLRRALDIIADIYTHPLLPEEEVEREKGVIIDEIQMYNDRPEQVASDAFMELLYDDQPAGWNIAGTKESVQTMTRDAIIQYRTRHYVASATAVVIAGGSFEARPIIRLVEEKFKHVSTGRKHTKVRTRDTQTQPAERIIYRASDQAHIVFGVRTYRSRHPDSAALAILAAVLGQGMSSRLFQRLREEMGVGYAVSASNHTYSDHGFLSIRTGVTAARTEEVLRAIVQECARVTDELISDDEMRRVKDFIAGHMLLGLESSDEIAEYYGIQEIMRHELMTPAARLRELRSVTARDVRRVARKVFRDNRANLVVVGPFPEHVSFRRLIRLRE